MFFLLPSSSSLFAFGLTVAAFVILKCIWGFAANSPPSLCNTEWPSHLQVNNQQLLFTVSPCNTSISLGITVADILLGFVFIMWLGKLWNQCPFSLPSMYGYYLYVTGVYLYNALYFGDAWLPKTKSLSQRALQKVLHCPILVPCEVPVPVCLRRNVSFCSFLLENHVTYFESLLIFIKLNMWWRDTFWK